MTSLARRMYLSAQHGSGEARRGQAGSGHLRSGQVGSGQVRLGQARSGQIRSGHVREKEQHAACPPTTLLLIDTKQNERKQATINKRHTQARTQARPPLSGGRSPGPGGARRPRSSARHCSSAAAHPCRSPSTPAPRPPPRATPRGPVETSAGSRTFQFPPQRGWMGERRCRGGNVGKGGGVV